MEMKRPPAHFIFFLFCWFSKMLSAQFGAQPPFVFDLEAVNANLPGHHSFAFAQAGNKWLIIGGRTTGLHGMSSNDGFDPVFANNNVVVIDTSTWQVYTSSLSNLPYAIADPLRSTNMEYAADSAYLYIIGGFGTDSVQNRFVTFPTLTAVRIDSTIDAVMNNTSLAPHIRQITDTNLRVCGGEMKKMNGTYYLCFGHDFEGRYADPPVPTFTQVYANQIKKFNIADNGNSISLTNYTALTDTDNFHRRDLNLVPEIMPNGNEALGAYAGVFQKTGNYPWREPITIQNNGVTVHTYQQTMNHYGCMNIPIYDSVTQKMFVTFFGGISLNDYNPQSNTITQDTLIPFISDVTTLRKDPNGYMEETVLPLQLPGLLGANALFVPRTDIMAYQNGVIRFRDLPNQRTLIGYMLGGIRASGTNLQPTSANDTVYRVFITPDLAFGIHDENYSVSLFNIFPDPFSENARIRFSLLKEEDVTISVYDLAGRVDELIMKKKCNAGISSFDWNTSLSPGMYLVELCAGGSRKTIKVVIQ